ncbi:unnamed protein product [Parnassius mnemosyne]|uniref:Lipase domain-containing protein n=1 Tax=Parnassius mnemosyne TaxID=213953 RepID=A0AAV1LZD7_9NEOP
MPDGKGLPHRIDLDEPVDVEVLKTTNGSSNQYWLFTRRNPTEAQLLVYGNPDSVRNSNYKRNRPLKVIVHGWLGDGNADVNKRVTSAFLDTEDVNVIVVDWRRLAFAGYFTSVDAIPSVGQYIAYFLIWLFNTAGGNWNNVHLVGFSLGAHVVGNVGRTVDGRPRRVTGLDPAGPGFHDNSKALNVNSGRYVESINTDGWRFGIMDPIAHANFYPNGGRNPQPGCWFSTCSHSRAYELFASSVRTNHFVGRRCNNLNEAENNRCSGDILNMGNDNMSKSG